MDDAEVGAEVDAELAARLERVRRREHIQQLRKREWVYLSILLVLSVGAFFNFKRVVVSGHSMDPTFHTGQTVLVWKFAPRRLLRPGDVIVFRQGNEDLIKRIVYVADPRQAGVFPPPGFPRQIPTPNGVVGDAQNNQLGMTFAVYFFRVRVGLSATPPLSHTIYVMGDNFKRSEDSRDFGPIGPDQVLGKVVVR